ncbi:LADA_0D10374g1_1 [Lachancea dasiensis]|uniref:Dolichyl-diphosphooligosaccharide--protein glycosyltransferase subunit 1 n=1 Tax=Lachancea dasiensis TaxID=1072105 RepID=A0A1G4J7S7_9SACH|nr:LADA_0D10374g1_1 [Lachancea dasiensis]
MMVTSTLYMVLQVVIGVVLAQADAASLSKSWENVAYHRTVDVSRTYTQERIDLHIKNIDNKAIEEYYFVLPEGIFENIALFSAQLKRADAFLESAIIPQQTFVANGEHVKVAVVKMPTSVEPGSSTDIAITLVYGSHRQPYSGSVEMGERQLLHLSTNTYPLSAYNTQQYTMSLEGSPSIEVVSNSSDDNFSCRKEGSRLDCESHKAIGPYQKTAPLKIVFERNLPSSRVSFLAREVWVSHWASTMQFEESYDLVNDAAPLKGGFSRAEYMKGQHAMKQHGHLTALEMVLPSDSEEHYFTDLVGAVSTFRVLQDHIFLKPRFPIFGGWKYNFTIGWTNGLSQFLHIEDVDTESFVLSVPILNGPADTYYSKMNLSVYLPEGSEVLDVWCPLPVVSTEVTASKSYFDLNNGHTKVTFELNNMVDTVSTSKVFVRYKFSTFSFYRKPISIAASIFISLMAFFFLKQITFTIEN